MDATLLHLYWNIDKFATKHLSEIFEGLYLTNRAEKIARDFQNDSVETTKDKYLLTFHPLIMSGG